MSGSEDDKPGVELTKAAPTLTPPGYKVQLSINQAVAIAEFVDSPVFKLLEKVYVAQRKDHIARTALNGAQDDTQLHFYKGAAHELVMFFKNMREVKKTLAQEEAKE